MQGLPKPFAERKGFYNGIEDCLLLTKEGGEWPSKLKLYNGKLYLVGGWKAFCNDNGLNVGKGCKLTLHRKDQNSVVLMYSV